MERGAAPGCFRRGGSGGLTWMAGQFRASEWVVLLYFSYTAILAASFPVPPGRRLVSAAAPVLLFALGAAGSRNPKRWTSIARDWLPAALVLGAYWQLNWFQSPHRMVGLENLFLRFDETILTRMRLHQAIESMGPVIPTLLEAAYTLLYAIPPLSIAALYVYAGGAAWTVSCFHSCLALSVPMPCCRISRQRRRGSSSLPWTFLRMPPPGGA